VSFFGAKMAENNYYRTLHQTRQKIKKKIKKNGI
jgi:hypothetical protein